MNIIAFGQQPNGIFPKRFFYAKIQTALRLQKEIGGKIVLFYHDSDADYRETITIMIDKATHQEVRLNFTQENKIQKNFSPLYLKRIPAGWKEETLKQLPRFISADLIDLFKSTEATNAADFCLEMYKKLRLLDGIDIVRSSDKNFRENAHSLTEDFYADVPYENETVRARILPSPSRRSDVALAKLDEGRDQGRDYIAQLHHGGGKTSEFEITDEIKKSQITPGRDQRFGWMNSVIGATHYITGNAEYDYLKREDFPSVQYIKRDQIENQDLAWLS